MRETQIGWEVSIGPPDLYYYSTFTPCVGETNTEIQYSRLFSLLLNSRRYSKVKSWCLQVGLQLVQTAIVLSDQDVKSKEKGTILHNKP
jgi:hypothetical protein